MPSTLQIVQAFVPDATNNDIDANPIAQRNAKRMALSTATPNGHLANDKPYATSIPESAITLERSPWIPKPGSALKDPSIPRANIAVSEETPNGTPGWAETRKHQTVLQQHCAYWDPDQDGVIYPWDIYNGCRAWGWHPILSLIVVLVIAPTMSYATQPKGHFLPDPYFRLYLNNMHKNKHGSDSNTYDPEGRFRPQQFEDIFAKYDTDNKGGLNLYDLARAHKGQRLTADPFGWTASILEWLALYLLIWPDDGVMRKEDIRASFDGSLFQRKADDFAKKQREAGRR